VNGSDGPLRNTAAFAGTLDHVGFQLQAERYEARRSSFRIAFSFVVIVFAFFLVVLFFFFFVFVFADSSNQGVGSDDPISRNRKIYSAHTQMVRSIEEIFSSMKKNDTEEFRVRMAFLTKKYADVISDSKVAD
jgi:hypothetical protein